MNIKNLNINMELNEYLLYYVISFSGIENKYKNEANKFIGIAQTDVLKINFLKKKYNLYSKIVNINILNNEILKDQRRNWRFFFIKNNKNVYLDRTSYNSLNEEKNKILNNDQLFIKNLDTELNILTNSDEIKTKIKITSYQSIFANVVTHLTSFLKIFEQSIMNRNIFVKLNQSKENVIIEIYDVNNNIISNINSYFILEIQNTNSSKTYDICQINFTLKINFTEDNINIEYNFLYKDKFYKNITNYIYKLLKNFNNKDDESIKNFENEMYFIYDNFYLISKIQNSKRLNLFLQKFKDDKYSENLKKINKILSNANIANNLDKQQIFYKYIYQLLKNVDNKDEESIKNFDKEINFLYEKYSLISTIPIKKEITDKVESDFLIISYNEGAKRFTYEDCIPIIFKVLNENPSFIIICTQESSSGSLQNIINATHYQHILDKYLLKMNYERIIKVDASISGIKDKNIRTRIYINKFTVIYDKKYYNKNNSKNIKENNSFILYKNIEEDYEEKIAGYSKKNIKDKNNNIDCRYIIKSFGSKKSVKHELGSSAGLMFKKEFTFYKESIFTRLEFFNGKNEYKIIIINSYLFYKNTDIAKSKKEIDNIINEFKLIEYRTKGYNIFFCGDMNFRLNYDLDQNKMNKQMMNEYLLNKSFYKKNSYKKLILKNELYKYIFNDSSYNKYKESFIKILKQYIDNNKINNKYSFLKKYKETYKYNNNSVNYKLTNNNYNELFERIEKHDYENLSDNSYIKEFEEDFKKYINITFGDDNLKMSLFYLEILNSIENLGIHLTSNDIVSQKNDKNRYAIDRIIYALSEENSNIEISPYNFDVHLFPNKSNHKMISLSFNLCNNKSDKKFNTSTIFTPGIVSGNQPSNPTNNQIRNQTSDQPSNQTNNKPVNSISVINNPVVNQEVNPVVNNEVNQEVNNEVNQEVNNEVNNEETKSTSKFADEPLKNRKGVILKNGNEIIYKHTSGKNHIGKIKYNESEKKYIVEFINNRFKKEFNNIKHRITKK
jgi:hypothetical protein